MVIFIVFNLNKMHKYVFKKYTFFIQNTTDHETYSYFLQQFRQLYFFWVQTK